MSPKEPVLRARQAEILAERLALVLAPMQAAALLRVAGALAASVGTPLTLAAAALWAAATAGWAWRYGGWMGRPRVDGRPG